jgi:hypothetical protein
MVCLIIWPLGLIAIIIYHRKLQNVKLLTSKWTFAIWLSLFFPKLSDPFLTNFGKLLYLFVFLFVLFGVDTFVLPGDEYKTISSLGKKCWILSAVAAVALSTFLIRFRPEKEKASHNQRMNQTG